MCEKHPFFKNNVLRSGHLLKISIVCIPFIVLYLYLHFPQAYAAQVLPSKNLDRRPLHSTNAETRMKRQEEIPPSLLSYLLYCDQNKIVIKQDNAQDEVSIVNIDGENYPINGLPNQISYRTLTSEEAGEPGAKGLVILPSAGFDIPTNISMYTNVTGMPVPIRTMFLLDSRKDHCHSLQGARLNNIDLRPRLCGKRFSNPYYEEYEHHINLFGMPATQDLLRNANGNLTIIDNEYGGTKLWGLHLDRSTGFDLSGFENPNINAGDFVVIFLDQHLGEIEVDSTAIMPNKKILLSFIGVDSSLSANRQNPPRMMDAPTSIRYNGTESSLVLDCQSAETCAIWNVNLNIIDSTLKERELISGPTGSSFALSVTHHNETGASQTYFFERDAHGQYVSPSITNEHCSLSDSGITVYSDQDIDNINDLVCSMCPSEQHICTVGDFCTGNDRHCPNQLTFDRHVIDCNVYPATTTLPTITTSTAATIATAAATFTLEGLGSNTILKFTTGAAWSTGFLAAAGLTATVVITAGGLYYCYHYGKYCFRKRKTAYYYPSSSIEHQVSDHEASFTPQNQESLSSSQDRDSAHSSSVEMQEHFDDHTTHDHQNPDDGLSSPIVSHV